MERLTREQSAIIGAYTGITAGPFDAIHEYAEKKMGRPVYSHSFGSQKFADQLKEAATEDFMNLVHVEGSL